MEGTHAVGRQPFMPDSTLSTRSAALHARLAKYPSGNHKIIPRIVFLESFGDSSLNLELVVWSAEMSFRPRRFRSDLNFAIEKALRERGIEIPFPQRDLHIRSRSEIFAERG